MMLKRRPLIHQKKQKKWPRETIRFTKRIRQEILNAKRHREFMLRVQKQKAKI